MRLEVEPPMDAGPLEVVLSAHDAALLLGIFVGVSLLVVAAFAVLVSGWGR